MFINYGLINFYSSQSAQKEQSLVQPGLPQPDDPEVQLPGGHLRAQQAAGTLQTLFPNPPDPQTPGIDHNSKMTQTLLKPAEKVFRKILAGVQRDPDRDINKRLGLGVCGEELDLLEN